MKAGRRGWGCAAVALAALALGEPAGAAPVGSLSPGALVQAVADPEALADPVPGMSDLRPALEVDRALQQGAAAVQAEAAAGLARTEVARAAVQAQATAPQPLTGPSWLPDGVVSENLALLLAGLGAWVLLAKRRLSH